MAVHEHFYIEENDKLLAEKYQSVPLEYENLIYKYIDPQKELTVFEIGACECEDTLKLQRLFPNSDIHAFEPVASNYKKGLRAISGVTLNNIAISDHKGEEDIFLSSGSPTGKGEFYGNKSSSLLKPHKHLEIFGWCKFDNKERVKVDTLLNYVTDKNINHIHFIHMDIQGAELRALKGCGDFINNIDLVFLEVAKIELYKGQALLQDINDFFVYHGFELAYQNVSDVAGNQLWTRIKSDLIFDTIPKYCINLSEEAGRRVVVSEEFEKLGLSVNFYNAINGKTLTRNKTMSANEIACLRSHKNIIKEAKRCNSEYVYICEDDVEFCDDFWKRMRYIESCGLDYDMLFLGGHFSSEESMPIESSPTVYDNIFRVYRVAGTYSYIVRKSVYDRIIETPERLAIDALYCFFIQRLVKTYAFVPFLTTCRPCISTITGKYIDYPHVKWYYTQKSTMITYTKLGKNGRLGNQLFQAAAAIAIAKSKDTKVNLPTNWMYRDYFSVPDEFFGDPSPDTCINVSNYHYDLSKLDGVDFKKCVDLFGYFQSEKYFLGIKDDIRKYFTPKVKKLDKWSVGMHIRRGDFVGNQSHINLGPEYYISAIDKYFNDKRYTFYICTDDPEYARFHFKGDKFIIEDRNELEDFETMISCQNHILANSSFSWWGAYLAQSKKVIRPAKSFRGCLEVLSDADLWQPEWICHEDHRIDLSDVTFITPFKYDHVDRLDNLNIFMDHLSRTYKTNVLIGESGGSILKNKYPDNLVDLSFIKTFHHTRINNILAALSKTEIVINVDCDVIVPPNQIYEAVKMLRDGYGFVFPYDGTFVRVGNGPNDRNQECIDEIKTSGDIGIIKGREFFGMSADNPESFGGAFGFTKSEYFKYKGDNEKYVSYAPEDADRAYRFKMLTKYGRTQGPLYHLNHFCGIDSTNKNPYFKNSVKEWNKVRAMDKDELLAYIDTWEWDYTNVKSIDDIKGSTVAQSSVKHDLTDVTFIIPVKYDHPDRRENLDIVLDWLQWHFDVNIIVGEQETHEFEYVKSRGCSYMRFDYDCFHRTKMLNQMTIAAPTNIVINHDADVILPIDGLLEAIGLLREGNPIVYPYSGKFLGVSRYYINLIKATCEAECLEGVSLSVKSSDSFGGSFGFLRDKYFGEDCNFYSHAPEDWARAYLSKLVFGGYKRVNYPLYHLDHYCGKDSRHSGHDYVVLNNTERRRVMSVKTKAEAIRFIESWPWFKEYRAKLGLPPKLIL
jgi:FkbM family methyltransferase